MNAPTPPPPNSPADQPSLPAQLRPIRLIRRHDLVFEEMEFQDITFLVVKDPLTLKYHRLRPEEAAALHMLDGQTSLSEARERLEAGYPEIPWSLKQVQELFLDLHQKNLVRSVEPDQDIAAIRRRRTKRWEELKKKAKNFLFIQFPGWDPAGALDWLYPKVKWLFSTPMIVLSILLWVWSAGLVFVEWETFYAQLPGFERFFALQNLGALYIVIAGTKILHEFGHGLACRHFGCECHQMGVMLLVFSPTLYCDTSDSWMLKNKWKRIAIGGGGVLIEMLLSAIALFVWWNTREGMLHYLCFNIWTICSVSVVVFNLNPLMRFDGYYMLSDYLEIPNLRENADKLLKDSFSKWCIGIDPPPDRKRPQQRIFGFVTYAVLAWAYRWFIMLSITWMLWHFFKPYGLQVIGLLMALAAIVGMIFTFLRYVYKTVTAPRTVPIDHRKPLATALILGLLVALLCWPFDYYVQSEFLVRPYEETGVFVQTEGELVTVHVAAGDEVGKGDVLAELRNEQLESRLREIRIELETARRSLEVAEETQNPYEMVRSKARVESLSAEEADLDERVKRLRITAPVAGVVVEPPVVPEGQEGETGRKLATWAGSPLDPQNAGAALAVQTQLLSIAPVQDAEAIMLIHQDDRNAMGVGDRVELRLESAPDHTYRGEILSISYQPVSTGNEEQSDAGGVPALLGDDAGEPVYQASVKLEGASHLAHADFRGTAQLLVGKRSYARRFWRWASYTLRFRT